jgi:hypothetical protein
MTHKARWYVPLEENIIKYLPPQYAILYKCRNNSELERDHMIKEIYQQINFKNLVNLKKPDWVIIVEIIKVDIHNLGSKDNLL